MRVSASNNLRYARIAGVSYLFIIGLGIVAQVIVRDRFVDYNDAGVTAGAILNNEFLFRLGFVCQLFMLVFDVIVTSLLFLLLRPVAGGLTIISTVFRVVSIAVLATVALSHYASILVITNNSGLESFTLQQQQTHALLSLKLHGPGYNISLFFFGFHLCVLGYILFKYRVLPRTFGILLIIGGVCYIVNSVVWFLFPAAVSSIYPAILIPCFMSEILLCLWLLVKGVKIPEKK